ncbi:hypothetical protein SLEP1_g39352 [Rubroshorea leprosula]|uniref:Dof-type domain-containing protein n=1 Tax=Rubroshorea leprosula TaxID=152421 RepID=A0AAV5L0Q5_9ROSI|nr:hypothetical protein SLEP1_g39352 [Rubroshorea leprosula]
MNGGDPAIKLFGRKIPLPEIQIQAGGTRNETTNPETEISHVNPSEETGKCITTDDEREKHQGADQVNEVQVNFKPKEDHSESNNTDAEKAFKKPDKVLPCPRCNSLDTKFCYFNNYNVNQPRHFCKNCQRYWTAGGTMRNVPIGAGRRKNKHLVSQYRQIVVSPDGVPITRIETPDAANQQILSSGESATATTFRPLVGNGTVLKFGTEAPLCDSMETVLSLGDQNRCNEKGMGNSIEIREGLSSGGGPSMTVSSIQGNELSENAVRKEPAGVPGSNETNAPHPLHCYPVSPLVFPLNSGVNNIAAMAAGQGSQQASALNSSNANPAQWCSTPMVAVPGFCPPNIPLQFVPAAYWGCMHLWTAASGNMSLTGSNGCSSPSSNSNSCLSSNGSPTLGKHSREVNFVGEEQSDKSVLVPKILRIDDPNEASRSPIWTTLGIKPDQKVAVSGGNIFKAFEHKEKGKDCSLDDSHILEANPAALSRSHTFQEST